MITKDLILQCVCKVIEVNPSDVLKSRHETGAKDENVAYARQLCMYLAREYKLGSQAAVGKYYGGRDHATVIHAEKTISNELNIYSNKVVTYNQIRLLIIREAVKNIETILKERMEVELTMFINKAKEISASILRDLNERTEQIGKLKT